MTMTFSCSTNPNRTKLPGHLYITPKGAARPLSRVPGSSVLETLQLLSQHNAGDLYALLTSGVGATSEDLKERRGTIFSTHTH